jgi:hypothetical protein
VTTLRGARLLITRDIGSRGFLIFAGVLVPAAVGLALVPLRGFVPPPDAALLLVLTVIAVAASGYRPAGLAATLSAAVTFDLLLAPPYGRLAIASREDVETAVLIVAVGVAVTSLGRAVRRHQAELEASSTDLARVHAAAQVASMGGSPTELADRVADMLTSTLRLRGCSFAFGPGGGKPVLDHDGTVRWGEVIWDVEANGLPLTTPTELAVCTGGRVCGRFLLLGAPGASPTLDQRMAAAALADQVGAAMADYYPQEIWNDRA